jgi:DNA-binding MarR family transcriptional regulator
MVAELVRVVWSVTMQPQAFEQVMDIRSASTRLGLEPAIEEIKLKISEVEQRLQRQSAQQVTADQVRAILRARAQRRKFFPKDLFADPAWDMLLDLYASDLDQSRTSVGSLCIASDVPATTALRWISNLEREGLVTRQNDPLDGRRVWIDLTQSGRDAMEAYFASISPKMMPL